MKEHRIMSRVLNVYEYVSLYSSPWSKRVADKNPKNFNQFMNKVIQNYLPEELEEVEEVVVPLRP